MSEEELLPCPCCGGKAVMLVVHPPRRSSRTSASYCIQCRECRLNTGWHDIPEAPADIWNIRTAVTETDFARAVHDGRVWQVVE